MTPVPLVPFLNLHYLYCFIISIFGSKCTAAPSVSLPDITATTSAAVQSAASNGGSFWSWLWPFGSSASSAGSSGSSAVGTAAQSTIWSDLYASMPTFLQSIFDIIYSIVSWVWFLFSWMSWGVASVLFTFILTALVIVALLLLREWQGGAGEERVHARADSKRKLAWDALLNEVLTAEPKRWRAALMTADEWAGELLISQGFTGASTAELLRSVPDDAFISVGSLWEAHRVTNFARAPSSDYVLTQREAYRVMKLYEQFFEEFRFI